jgi:4'-phosphopantetheinyl transferase
MAGSLSEEEGAAALAPGRVEVWLTPLDRVGEDLQKRYVELLDPEELRRWRGFLVEEPRLQFLVAHALLRVALSRHAPVPPRDWAFAKNEYGRPHVAAPEAHRGIVFNISHAEGLVACALGRGCDLGVDVECRAREVNFLGLARSKFAPSEADRLERAHPDRRRSIFFDHWTLKESYIKARGMGLKIPLKVFWFDLEGDRPRIGFAPEWQDDPARWRFWRRDPTPRHRLALALSSDEPDVRVDVRWTVPLDHDACRDLTDFVLTAPPSRGDDSFG